MCIHLVLIGSPGIFDRQWKQQSLLNPNLYVDLKN